MTTRRESYMQMLLANLSAKPALRALGVTFVRSLFEAVSSAEGRVLVVSRGRDTPVETNIGFTTRRCIVMLTVVVRDAAPDAAADEIFELSHPVVMAFDGEGLLGIEEGPTDEPQATGDEGGVGVLTMQYVFEYRTLPTTL